MRVEIEGQAGARIMLVGEAPGIEEDKTGKPFVGMAGTTLNALLSQAGIARYQCLISNVAKERPPANKISFFFLDYKCTVPKPKLVDWIAELKEEIKTYQPKVVIALGVTALWALTGEKKLSDFRGYCIDSTLVPGVPVLPTYHPQAVNYDWKLFFPTVLDLRKALKISEVEFFSYSQQMLSSNVSSKEFIAYMEFLLAHPEYDKLAIDVETVQPGSHIEELGLSHSPDFGMSIFLLKGRMPAMNEHDELLLWQTFARLVKVKKIIMQNGAYDCGVFWHNQHILIQNLYMDTLIAAHVCWPELPRDLGFLGSVCLNVPPWKHVKTGTYNAADAANTLGIAEVLETEISKQNIQTSFNFEMQLIPVALMMQLQGIKVDKETQSKLLQTWQQEKQNLRSQLDTLLGVEINFNSPKQMQRLLYFDLKLPVQYKRRKSKEDERTMTTDADALRTLHRLVPNNPVFNLILAYKKADMLLHFLGCLLSSNDTVHTSYNITGASSDDEEDTKKTKRSFGRWSSSASIILPYGSGNLQNIPNEARKMYKAAPGWKIIEADYSQAEAVVVATLCGNRKMMQMFKDSFGLSKTEKKPYDIHVLKASELYGVSIEEVTPAQRTVGKTVRHSRNYAAGPTVLANRLGVSIAQAKQLIELDKAADPLLEKWHEAINEEIKRTRVLTNLFGRRHRFLDRWGDSLFRSAYSYIPQSTIGDLLNKALLAVYDTHVKLPFELNILLQLHDALYVTCKEEHILDTLYFLRSNMLMPLVYGSSVFIIDVEFKIKSSWAEGEEVDFNWRDFDAKFLKGSSYIKASQD
jgi:uracil-DNA glycosylase family 4